MLTIFDLAHALLLLLLVAASFAWWRTHLRYQTLQQQHLELRRQLAESAVVVQESSQRLERFQREQPELIAGAKRQLAAALLPIDDHIQRACSFDDAAAHSLQEGLHLCAQDLERIWRSCEITRIHPTCGDPFDPNFHEAMVSTSDPSVLSPCIAEVFQDGFALDAHLLRPARVRVTIPEKKVENEAT